MESRFLLSLCIPTYNRAKFLDVSLNRIKDQFIGIAKEDIELIISDNCSTDDTPQVVDKYLNDGLPIRYIRNATNLGMDGNFVQCSRLAQGKYLWVLGDDDFLKENALTKILEVLRKDTYGLVHLEIGSKKAEFFAEQLNSQDFLSTISYWITFISSNIVNTKHVPDINFEKYIGTYFTLIPLYMTAALSENKNALIHPRVFEDGVDTQQNGGYNFFQVFVCNYLGIWKEFVDKGLLTRMAYEKEKYKLYNSFLTRFIFRLLIKKDKGNFQTEGGWTILFKYYGYYPYYYTSLIMIFLKAIKNDFSKNDIWGN
ncbi:MAG: hypothetical protein RL662_578 [Bacteroidota bacterium]|jgi:glycosyltransferase involved in cell wall biosynthesis